MTKPITKILINGFRGSTGSFELEFDHEKDMTMVFGENGSGKSTILDAMDVVCNGTTGCLDGVSVGQGSGKYLCALGCQASALRAEVYSGSECWTGTLSGNKVRVQGDVEKPVVRILRRNKILDLVIAQPGDRYKALQRFIDIAIVERSEATLKQKRDETRNNINRLVADRELMSIQLDKLWEEEDRPGPGRTAMEWAENIVESGITELNNRLVLLKSVVDAIAKAITACSDYKAKFDKLTNLRELIEELDRKIAAAPGVSSTTVLQLLESLSKAKEYIEATESLDKCPTCLRPMGRDELLAIVTRECDQLSELKKLSDDKKSVQKRQTIAASHLDEAKEKLISTLKGVEEAITGGDIPEIVALGIAWPSWDQAAENMDNLVEVCDKLDSVLEALTERREDAQRDVSQFNSIKEWWSGINDAVKEMADLDRIRIGLQKALDIVRSKRLAFTQGVLDEIRDEANRLYQMLHPGEDIGLEQLKMDEERRASVDQTAVFNGHTNIPPQAVFSESHLDTLGFCVWLALAKRESPERTVLLIDDIFSSVDAAHLSRVIDLFNAEAPKFLQVIVATHYRLWRDRCQSAHSIQRIDLGRWSVASGIASQNMPRVLDELRDQLEEPILDRQVIASKAGILLESILDDLTLLYECSLPRNVKNEYTLGALLSGCRKLFHNRELGVKINKNWDMDGQPEDWQDTAAKDAYDRIAKMSFIRNQVGCHFNISGMEIPDNEVRDFATSTIELVEALTCPHCGFIPTKIANNGTHLRCSCTKRAVRMTPVE